MRGAIPPSWRDAQFKNSTLPLSHLHTDKKILSKFYASLFKHSPFKTSKFWYVSSLRGRRGTSSLGKLHTRGN